MLDTSWPDATATRKRQLSPPDCCHLIFARVIAPDDHIHDWNSDKKVHLTTRNLDDTPIMAIATWFTTISLVRNSHDSVSVEKKQVQVKLAMLCVLRNCVWEHWYRHKFNGGTRLLNAKCFLTIELAICEVLWMFYGLEMYKLVITNFKHIM